MPSRTEFLSTGLVPVTNPSLLHLDGCSICTDPSKSPIALPCAHIFCKHCALDWLTLPSRNTCPFCRFECFPLAPVPTAAEAAAAAIARTALIAAAATSLTNNTFSTFSDDISWDTASLHSATIAATRWLNSPTAEVVGPAYIHKRHLGHALLAMGNLLQGYARVSGRAYTAREKGEWRIVIDLLYREIAGRHGMDGDALVLTWQLLSDVRRGLERATVGGVDQGMRASTFVTPQVVEGPAGDLHRLINFVACRAVEEERGRRARREEGLVRRVGMRVRDVLR